MPDDSPGETPAPPSDPTPPAPAPPGRSLGLGVADAHAVVAIACGLGALLASWLCCVSPIEEPWLVGTVGAVTVAALWSGLFGITTHGSTAGRVVALLGLLSVVSALLLTLVAMAFGRGGF